MPIDKKGDTFFIISLNFNYSIIKNDFYFTRTKPKCLKFPLKIFKLGIKWKIPITWLEIFDFDEFIMPPCPLLLDYACSLYDILSDLSNSFNYAIICFSTSERSSPNFIVVLKVSTWNSIGRKTCLP